MVNHRVKSRTEHPGTEQHTLEGQAYPSGRRQTDSVRHPWKRSVAAGSTQQPEPIARQLFEDARNGREREDCHTHGDQTEVDPPRDTDTEGGEPLDPAHFVRNAELPGRPHPRCHSQDPTEQDLRYPETASEDDFVFDIPEPRELDICRINVPLDDRSEGIGVLGEPAWDCRNDGDWFEEVTGAIKVASYHAPGFQLHPERQFVLKVSYADGAPQEVHLDADIFPDLQIGESDECGVKLTKLDEHTVGAQISLEPDLLGQLFVRNPNPRTTVTITRSSDHAEAGALGDQLVPFSPGDILAIGEYQIFLERQPVSSSRQFVEQFGHAHNYVTLGFATADFATAGSPPTKFALPEHALGDLEKIEHAIRTKVADSITRADAIQAFEEALNQGFGSIAALPHDYSVAYRNAECIRMINALNYLFGRACAAPTNDEQKAWFRFIKNNERRVEFADSTRKFVGRNWSKGVRSMRVGPGGFGLALIKLRICSDLVTDMQAAVSKVGALPIAKQTNQRRLIAVAEVARKRLPHADINWGEVRNELGSADRETRARAVAKMNKVLNPQGVFVAQDGFGETGCGFAFARVHRMLQLPHKEVVLVVEELPGFPMHWGGLCYDDSKLTIVLRGREEGDTTFHEIGHFLDGTSKYMSSVTGTGHFMAGAFESFSRDALVEATAFAYGYIMSDYSDRRIRNEIGRHSRVRSKQHRDALRLLEASIRDYEFRSQHVAAGTANAADDGKTNGKEKTKNNVRDALQAFLDAEYHRVLGIKHSTLFADPARIDPVEVGIRAVEGELNSRVKLNTGSEAMTRCLDC